MKKESGLLDKIQPNLCPDIWDSEKQLWSHVRNDILTRLSKIVPKNSVREIYLIGSTTGYQWTETSDVDLNITLDPPELCQDEILTNKRKTMSGLVAKATRHPINFFFVPWQGQEQFWGDAQFGVYDVINNKWVSDPGESSTWRDPKQEYALDILLANPIIRQFENLVKLYLSNIKSLKDIENLPNNYVTRYLTKSKVAELQKNVENLVEFCHEWDRRRKFVYTWGFGTPRKSWYNIVFKMLEDSEFSQYFEMFKELKANDYTTSLINKNRHA